MLEQIETIKDLKKLSVSQLPQLCEEIRQKLIAEVSDIWQAIWAWWN